jgi:hypothetical protein
MSNYYLGQLHAATESYVPLPAGSCEKGAAFRFTLALEQIINAGKYQLDVPIYARELLAVTPGVAHFNLNGVDVPRDEIQNLALGRGEMSLGIALNQTMLQLRTGWHANVHLNGFLLLGQNLLEEIEQRVERAGHDGRCPSMSTNIPPEVCLDREIMAMIAQEAPKIELKDMDAPVQAYVNVHAKESASASLTALAQEGLRHTWSKSEPIDEEGFRTDTHKVLHAMWRYIEIQSDAVLKQQLTDMLMRKLIEIGLDPVCNTGCVQRILMDVGTIDLTLTGKEPDVTVMQAIIYQKALQITDKVDMDYAAHYQNVPNRQQESVALKQDLIRADVTDDLIRRRGWDQHKVRAVLEPVLQQIQYL